MALLKKIGYGQVEPNHLSFQASKAVYAQLPCEDDLEILENGTFLKYNYPAGRVNTEGETEWLMAWNEIKLYDNAKQGYKDFAMKRSTGLSTAGPTAYFNTGTMPWGTDPKPGTITPRMVRVQPGDIMTTNMIDVDDENTLPEVGTTLSIKTVYPTGITTGDAKKAKVGVLSTTGDGTGPVWQVVKKTTMPDGQPAVKIQLVKVVASAGAGA